MPMTIVFFGLSISSAWGNGHATTYRALVKALHRRGHRIVFFERDVEWYASNRDLPEPSFCILKLYQSWDEILPEVRKALRDADVAVVGSYFPDGIAALDEILASEVPVKSFYDIDTPITVAKLRNGGPGYLRKDQLARLDAYFSFTGGVLLQELKREFGVRRPLPLYCSFDPELYRPVHRSERFRCDVSYMGTYAADRQGKVDSFFRQPAMSLPKHAFVLAGAQYPPEFRLPANVRRVPHVSPNEHAEFYSSSLVTLNLTREEMATVGYSPSVRLFEAAACGSAIISDCWAGLDEFFEPGEQILLAATTEDVNSYLGDLTPGDFAKIGRRARERALEEHHPDKRAEQFEIGITPRSSSEANIMAPANSHSNCTDDIPLSTI
jgi:spore maturation protein CgeB